MDGHWKINNVYRQSEFQRNLKEKSYPKLALESWIHQKYGKMRQEICSRKPLAVFERLVFLTFMTLFKNSRILSISAKEQMVLRVLVDHTIYPTAHLLVIQYAVCILIAAREHKMSEFLCLRQQLQLISPGATLRLTVRTKHKST